MGLLMYLVLLLIQTIFKNRAITLRVVQMGTYKPWIKFLVSGYLDDTYENTLLIYVVNLSKGCSFVYKYYKWLIYFCCSYM